MIPVEPAPEPQDFDRKVRQPGLGAIAESVGELPTIKRRGPRRKKVADYREDIPSESFLPFWRAALDDMMAPFIAMELGLQGTLRPEDAGFLSNPPPG
jgi:hypothetical protein